MIRSDKVKLVDEMNQALSKTPHVILTSFSGLSVNQSTEMRAKVREAGGSYTVIKNRLAKRAAAGTALEPLVPMLTGPCGIATHESDPVVLAKTIADFSKANEQLEVLAGVIDAKELVDAAGVKQLASLPGLPELRAQLLSLIQTPATTLVRLLGTPGTQLARVLDARSEQSDS